VLFALNFYSEFLVGQTVGMGDALNLLAVKAAMELEAIDGRDMNDLCSRCFLIHDSVLRLSKRKGKRG